MTLLTERLKSAGEYEAIGGPAYVCEVAQSVPVAAHAAYYANIVREKAATRRFLLAGIDIVHAAHDPAATSHDLIIQADDLINQAASTDQSKATITAADALVKTMEHIDAMETRGRGQPTGLADASLTIAAPPGGLTVADIRRLACQQVRGTGLSLLVIDYLQLLAADNPRDARHLQVATMTRALKAATRELQIPVLCVAQLNREVEAKGSHRPQLRHLRESGSIEQDADVVWFIHREEKYSDDPEHRGKAELITGKNRNGIARNYGLTWDGPTTTFRTPAAGWDEFGGFGEPEATK